MHDCGMEPLHSPRLGYRAVDEPDIDVFHALITDAHVRRYLCDGQILPREWAADAVAASKRLFATRGVGLWLVREHGDGAPIGFAGFVDFGHTEGFEIFGGEPQLLYALREEATGRGYAAEAATACIRHARERAGFTAVCAAVDEPNQASVRVLERLGFARCGQQPGGFGQTILFRLET
jgi:ribosomal-protein-alanine N-acetyltransferase